MKINSKHTIIEITATLIQKMEKVLDLRINNPKLVSVYYP